MEYMECNIKKRIITSPTSIIYSISYALSCATFKKLFLIKYTVAKYTLKHTHHTFYFKNTFTIFIKVFYQILFDIKNKKNMKQQYAHD